MVRLYLYVEGQTEQVYAARVLRPHLAGFGVQVMGAVLAASGRKHGHVSRGGARRYQPHPRAMTCPEGQEADQGGEAGPQEYRAKAPT